MAPVKHRTKKEDSQIETLFKKFKDKLANLENAASPPEV